MKARESLGFTVKSAAGAKAPREVEFKIANARWERIEAFRLLHDAYVERGLMNAQDTKLRVTPHHLLATTDIFVAKVDGEVVFTASMARDSEHGLPIDCTYGDIANKLRSMDVRLAETFCLAGRYRSATQGFHLLQGLNRLMVQYAWHHGIDQVLIAVHPRQLNFYSKYLDFKCVGGLRQYASVRGNPAVCCSLDIQKSSNTPVWEKIWAERIPVERLQSQPMAEDELLYYGEFVPSFVEESESNEQELQTMVVA